MDVVVRPGSSRGYASELGRQKPSVFDDVNGNAINGVSRWHADVATGGVLGSAVVLQTEGMTAVDLRGYRWDVHSAFAGSEGCELYAHELVPCKDNIFDELFEMVELEA